MRHEREHVAGGDTWLLALATFAVAAMPWNLALWWQHRRLRLAVETDCDARVLAGGASRRAYGRALIRTAGDSRVLSLLSPAWAEPSSHLERRIEALTATPPVHRFLRSLPLLGLTTALLALACDTTASERGVAEPGIAGTDAPADESRAIHYVHLRGVRGVEVRVRVMVEGDGASAAVHSAATWFAAEDGAFDLVTPAVLRVHAPDGFSARAEVVDPDRSVQLVALDRPEFGFGSPYAVGPVPLIRVGRGPAPLQRPPESPPRPAPDFIDRAELGEVEPGHVRVESASGEPIRVRVDDEGSGTRIAVLGAAGLFRDVGGPFIEQPVPAAFEGGSFEIVTPADLRVEGGRRYHVRLTPTDPEARLRVRAVGGPDHGFDSTAANAAVVVLAGSPESGGIRGLPWRSP